MTRTRFWPRAITSNLFWKPATAGSGDITLASELLSELKKVRCRKLFLENNFTTSSRFFQFEPLHKSPSKFSHPASLPRRELWSDDFPKYIARSRPFRRRTDRLKENQSTARRCADHGCRRNERPDPVQTSLCRHRL